MQVRRSDSEYSVIEKIRDALAMFVAALQALIGGAIVSLSIWAGGYLLLSKFLPGWLAAILVSAVVVSFVATSWRGVVELAHWILWHVDD